VTSAVRQFENVVRNHLRVVFNYSLRMSLDNERACAVVEEVFLRAYMGQKQMPEEEMCLAWLLRIAGYVLEKKLSRTPDLDWDLLDDTLRSDATRTDVVRSLSEPKRDVMLWELKQGCMTAVVNCLSPGERGAFVLAHVIKLDDMLAAKTLGIKPAAYKVRLSRANKKISGYLSSRCEHVDPLNPCHCPARIGVALAKGFIRPVGEVRLRQHSTPFGRYGSGEGNQDKPLRDVAAIYGSLPEPEPSPRLAERILGFLRDGSWKQLRQDELASSSSRK